MNAAATGREATGCGCFWKLFGFYFILKYGFLNFNPSIMVINANTVLLKSYCLSAIP